jgi:hypothetical protein
MDHPPHLTSAERIYQREGYQALQRSVRPPYWGIDADWSRRPGVPRQFSPPRPFPNARLPIARQRGKPASPLHGRSNKSLPPVFGTSTPLRGLAGVIRKLAYRAPDHFPRHWLLLLLGDRVDAWTYRAKKLMPWAIPLAVAAVWWRSFEERPAAT